VSPRWQPSLDDYVHLAAYLLDADRAAIAALPRIALAESAVHAPFASFGGVEAYPDLVEQAAVLLERLARNHPLPTPISARRSFSWRASSTPTG
jgi:death-on-curing protein